MVTYKLLYLIDLANIHLFIACIITPVVLLHFLLSCHISSCLTHFCQSLCSITFTTYCSVLTTLTHYNNIEKERATCRQTYWSNPDKEKARRRLSYTNGAEKEKEASRIAYALNPERKRAASKQSYAANPQKRRSTAKLYYSLHAVVVKVFGSDRSYLCLYV